MPLGMINLWLDPKKSVFMICSFFAIILPSGLEAIDVFIPI